MDTDFNTKCYTFKHIEYESGLLDETVDCTYVIHLENNGRLEHIMSELDTFKPTKKCCIVFNKGFKKCNKRLIDQAPYQDLTDAFLQCFKHARTNGHKNILILEDDFIFSKEILKESHRAHIHRFLKANAHTDFVYHLGLIPIIAYPTMDLYTYTSIKSVTMHSAIYSEKCIQNASGLATHYKHWDVIIEKSIKNRYFYYKPLCYQTFPETENKKTWQEKDGMLPVGAIKNSVINLLNLHTAPEPGFTILYYFAKCLALLAVVLVGIMGLYSIKFLFKKLYKKTSKRYFNYKFNKYII
jgi:GR25 family glycosyltransferase involved in LPS biosynthesis